MLQISAILLAALGIAHSVLGERYILIRLFKRDNLPRLFGGTEFTTRTLRFAWHVTTVAWFGIAAILWHASSGNVSLNAVASIIGYTCIASGLLPLFITRARHLSWVVFSLLAGFVFVQAPPNNSFKPSPLRGLVCAVTCTATLGRYAGRLNSGVMLQLVAA